MAEKIEIKKRKRSPNWDDAEKHLLRECIKDKLDIIENKCTDTNTNKSKMKAWINVMECFNELNAKDRTLAEIKQQWRTMKMDAKKSNSSFKKALKATGGGMKPPSPDPNMIKIMEMMPLEFEEDVNQFDSDNINHETQTEMNAAEIYTLDDQDNMISSALMNPTEVEVIDDQVNKENQFHINEVEVLDEDLVTKNQLSQKSKTPDCKELKDISSCKRSLFEPIPGFKTSKKKRCNPNMEISESRNQRDNALISFLKDEHQCKMKQMAERHAWAEKEHLWAQKEHEIKLKNIELKKKLLEKQLLE